MAIDLHAHWIPRPLADALRKRRAVPRIEAVNDGEHLVTFLGRRTFGPELHDLDARRDLMRQCGIATQMLSLATLFGVHCLPAEQSLPLVTLFNNAAAAAVRSDPRRFAAIAALPLSDLALARGELQRAHAMDLRGAILPADAFITRAAAERLLPLFETADKLGSHLFVHPGPVQPRSAAEMQAAALDNAWQRTIVLETQARLSQVVMTLELTSFLEPFRNVTVQVANLGGAMPFLAERMDEVGRFESAGEPPPSARVGRCYVDTASFGPRAIELAVAYFGPARVVLGTDCPIFSAARMRASVHEARLDSSIRDLLLTGNARRILRMKDVAIMGADG